MPAIIMRHAYPGMMAHGHPVFGVLLLIVLWLVQVIIAYFVYRDASDKKMSAPVWFLLIIIPFFGYLAALVYLIITGIRKPVEPGKTPLDILKERYAKGEITTEEYDAAKEILTK